MDNQPEKALWIPCALAGLAVFVIGWIRFPETSANTHFISAVLIAFGIAAFPWIRTFKIKGLVEIERAINSVKNDTKEKVDDAKQHFDVRFQALQTSVSSVQNQVSQMSLRQDFSQNQNIFVGTEHREASEEEKKKEEEVAQDLELSVGERRGWLRRIWGLVKRPLIHKASQMLSLPASALQYDQQITISSSTIHDPLISISRANFDAAHYGESRDTFFKVLMGNISVDDLSNMLFRMLSILQKYAEVKGKPYTIVLVGLIGDQNVTNERADQVDRLLNDDFSAFVSANLLRFERVEPEVIFERAKQSEKNEKKTETKEGEKEKSD